MKRITALLCILLSLCLICGCSVTAEASDLMDGITPNPVSGKTADSKFLSSQNDFAANLFKETYNGNNTLVSPLSVMLALAMTANGAKGSTLNEMETVLGAGISAELLNEYLYSYVKSLPSDEGGRLKIANSIWYKDDTGLSVKSDFLQKNADYYNAAAYKIPFNDAAVNEINRWVDDNTDGLIDKIIDSISQDNVMFLINALCFDGEWNRIYEDIDIREESFRNIGGERTTVEMMHSDESFYLSDDNSTGFIKHYKGGNYAFAALLPDESIPFENFIDSLTGEKISSILNTAEQTAVKVKLPKFSYDCSYNLKKTLSKLGMPSAFTNEADLSGISDLELYISDVIHKTYISVDEKGTKAGAVTSVAVDGASLMPDRTPTVYLDRPFVYMIIDCRHNLPLFLGSVTEM